MLTKLSGSVMILGSHILDPGDDYGEVDDRLTLSYKIETKAPDDESHHEEPGREEPTASSEARTGSTIPENKGEPETLAPTGKKRKIQEGQNSEGTSVTREEKKVKTITIRPLNMADFREAKNQVAASYAAEGSAMNKLKQWNELYGEGGSRKKE
ncbi:hypothetical protein DCAR_0205534 [Daucus carota subsp. sativus]|uniref:Uncharacterized protein n=1 Tax=Daucus carota subsp. sativus TaxID=79200 RepID=A0A166CPL1_DAUCS|nr:hypothetical protein DCAR_0205534 [Daucus carota subsp. sativus]